VPTKKIDGKKKGHYQEGKKDKPKEWEKIFKIMYLIRV
jgi:hypothetical protein